MNPAEFFADLISIDYSSSENEDLTQKRLQHLVQAFKEHRLNVNGEFSDKVVAKPRKIAKDDATVKKARSKHEKVGWWKQFRLLLKRAWLQVYHKSICIFHFIL